MAATRRRIAEAALDLFERDGFDRVAVADIARAAGVGERTVYRHFATKEAIAFGAEPDVFGAFVDALHQVPPDLSIVDAIRTTYRAFAPAGDDVPVDARRTALVLATPSLHRAWLAALAALEPRLRAWLAARARRPEDDIEVLAVTAALLAVHRVLVEAWDGTDITTYLDHADRALDRLDVGLRSFGG